MRRGQDIIAKYEAFHEEARASFARAADGPKKDAARLEMSLADAAELNGNETGWLLATDRTIRALA